MQSCKLTRASSLASNFFGQLPRQSPGNTSCTHKILNAVRFDLPASPRILDLGCGTGAQTLALLETLKTAKILAVDINPQFLVQLEENLSDAQAAQVRTENVDFDGYDFRHNHFHLIWSEGALYNMGLDKALYALKKHLVPDGFLVFSHLTWLVDDPSREVAAYWKKHFPRMPTLVNQMGAIQRAGYDLLEIQVLPETVWWDTYYNPIQEALPELEQANMPEARKLASQLRSEIEMYSKYGAEYSYVYYALQLMS